MYKQYDLAIPIQTEFVLNSKARSQVVEDFPKDIIDGIEVFTSMQIYHSSSGVTINEKYLNILKTLGVSRDLLLDGDWNGVRSTKVRFKSPDIEKTLITNKMIYDSIYDTIEDGVNTVQFNYTSRTKVNVDTLIPLLKDPDTFNQFDYVPEEEDNHNWFIAYSDSNEELYTRRFKIKGTTISKDAQGRYIYTTAIELSFTLRDRVELPAAIEVNDLLTKVHTRGIYSTEFLENKTLVDNDDLYHKVPKGISIHTTSEYESGNPAGYYHDTGQVVLSDSVTERRITFGNEVDITTTRRTYTTYVKVSGVRAMKLKNFVKFFKTSFEIKTKLKKGEWWEKYVAAVIVVLIVIIAVIVCVYSVGGCGFAMEFGLTAIASVASAVAITATVINIALTYYAEYLVSIGSLSNVAFIGRMAVISAEVAQYAGYISAIAGVSALIEHGFSNVVTTAGSNTGKAVVGQNGVTSVVTTGSGPTATTTVTTTMNPSQVTNAVFTKIVAPIANEVMKYDAVQEQEELSELSSSVAEQKELLLEYTTPPMDLDLKDVYMNVEHAHSKGMADQLAYMENYGYAEQMDHADTMVYNAAAGFVDNKMSAYFN